jgi:hypothetical protein
MNGCSAASKGTTDMRIASWAVSITLAGPVCLAWGGDVAPSYSKDVAPFLKKYCADCHNNNKAKAGYDLDSYDSLIKEGRKGRTAVVAGEPDKSRIVMVLDGRGKAMPPRKSPQPDEKDVAKLKDWIKDGAKNDLVKNDPKKVVADAKKAVLNVDVKKMPDKNKKMRRGDDDDDDDDKRTVRGKGREDDEKRAQRGKRQREGEDNDD